MLKFKGVSMEGIEENLILEVEEEEEQRWLDFKNFTIEKAVDFKDESGDEWGLIEGYASTPTKDRVGDVVEVEAFRSGLDEYKENPIVAWQHRWDLFIGKAVELKIVKEKGLWVKLLISKTVKDSYGNLIWATYIKTGIVKAFSIGFRPMRGKFVDGAYHILELKLLEISVVGIPANQTTIAENVKRIQANTDFTEAVAEKVAKKFFELLNSKNSAFKEIRKFFGIAFPIDEKSPIAYNVSEGDNMNVELKSVIPYKKYPLEDEGAKWDGNAQVKKADVKALKIICTWYDEEKPDSKTSYKLPHHLAEEYKTVWNGVKAAMGALLGARGRADIPDSEKKGVYDHLSKHYKDFSKDPPEFKIFEDEEELQKALDGTPIVKEGRTISKKTREKINKAITALDNCKKELQGLLDKTDVEDEADEDGKNIVQDAKNAENEVLSSVTAFLETLTFAKQTEETIRREVQNAD